LPPRFDSLGLPSDRLVRLGGSPGPLLELRLQTGWAVGAVALRPRFRRPPPNRTGGFRTHPALQWCTPDSVFLSGGRAVSASSQVAYLPAVPPTSLPPFALGTAFPSADSDEGSVAVGPPRVGARTLQAILLFLSGHVSRPV